MSAALCSRFSRPLLKKELPLCSELTPALLHQLYFTAGAYDGADRYWYFRPWLCRAPQTSGVYVRYLWAGYVEFSYYDTRARRWLLGHNRLVDAQNTAARYMQEQSEIRRELVYESRHQHSMWSSASLEDFENVDISDTGINETNTLLALLRWTVDPQRKRHTLNN